VIKEFNSPKGYLGPDKITAVDCGYMFEDLVRRFNESYGEEAGAHFTSRDIIYLMTDIVLCDTHFEGQNITVYDMAMGTSQMLSCMEERIHALDSEATVTCFGQEFNPSTFAIAKADMMIRGGEPDNMRFGDTLSDDQFKGFKFDRIISNPPFGIGSLPLLHRIHAVKIPLGKQGSEFRDAVPILLLVGYVAFVWLDVYGKSQGCQLSDHEIYLVLSPVLVHPVAYLGIYGLRAVEDDRRSVQADLIVIDLEPVLDPIPHACDDPLMVPTPDAKSAIECLLCDRFFLGEAELSPHHHIVQPVCT